MFDHWYLLWGMLVNNPRDVLVYKAPASSKFQAYSWGRKKTHFPQIIFQYWSNESWKTKFGTHREKSKSSTWMVSYPDLLQVDHIQCQKKPKRWYKASVLMPLGWLRYSLLTVSSLLSYSERTLERSSKRMMTWFFPRLLCSNSEPWLDFANTLALFAITRLHSETMSLIELTLRFFTNLFTYDPFYYIKIRHFQGHNSILDIKFRNDFHEIPSLIM